MRSLGAASARIAVPVDSKRRRKAGSAWNFCNTTWKATSSKFSLQRASSKLRTPRPSALHDFGSGESTISWNISRSPIIAAFVTMMAFSEKRQGTDSGRPPARAQGGRTKVKGCECL